MLKIRLFLIMIVTQSICAGIITSTLKAAASAYCRANMLVATLGDADPNTEDLNAEYKKLFLALPIGLQKLVEIKQLSTDHDQKPGVKNLFFAKFFVALLHHYWKNSLGTESDRVAEAVCKCEELYQAYAIAFNGLINPTKKDDGTECPAYYKFNTNSDLLVYSEFLYKTLKEFKIENLSTQKACITAFGLLLRKIIQTYSPNMIEGREITLSGVEKSKIISLYAQHYPERHPALEYPAIIRQVLDFLISSAKFTEIEIEQAIQDDEKKITSKFGQRLDSIMQVITEQHYQIPDFFNKKSNNEATEKMPIHYFSKATDTNVIEKKVYQSSEIAFLVRLLQKKMLKYTNDAFEKNYRVNVALPSSMRLKEHAKQYVRLHWVSNMNNLLRQDILKLFDDVLLFCVGHVDQTFFTESHDWYILLNVMKCAMDNSSIFEDYLTKNSPNALLILILGTKFFMEKFKFLSNNEEKLYDIILKEKECSATNLFNMKSWIKNLYELPGKCAANEQNARIMLENEEVNALQNIYDILVQRVRLKIQTEEIRERASYVRLALPDQEKFLRLGVKADYYKALARISFVTLRMLLVTYMQKKEQEYIRAHDQCIWEKNQQQQWIALDEAESECRSLLHSDELQARQSRSWLVNWYASYGIALNEWNKRIQREEMDPRTNIAKEQYRARLHIQSLRLQHDPVKIAYHAQQRGCVEQITMQQRALIESEESGNRLMLEQRLQKENEQKAREQIIQDEHLSRRLFVIQKWYHRSLVATLLQHMIAVPSLFNQVLIDEVSRAALQASRRAVGPVAVAVENNSPVRTAGDDVVPRQMVYSGPPTRYSHNPYALDTVMTAEI